MCIGRIIASRVVVSAVALAVAGCARPMTFQVIEGWSGAPVAGAEVARSFPSVRLLPSNSSSSRRLGWTDGRGRFTVSEVKPGDVVSFSTRGYRPANVYRGVAATRIHSSPWINPGHRPREAVRLRERDGTWLVALQPLNPHEARREEIDELLTSQRAFTALLRVDGPAGQRLLILDARQPNGIPGVAMATAHTFDEAGEWLGRWEFGLANRSVVTALDLVTPQEWGRPVLRLSTVYFNDARFGTTQYYGLAGDRLVLIRVEQHDQVPGRRAHFKPEWTYGPQAPGRDAEAWEKLLLNGEPAEVLEALRWIGGEHLGSTPPPRKGFLHLPGGDLLLAGEVRSHPRVREAIERMSKDANPWIREAARLALPTVSEEAAAVDVNPR